MKKYNTVTIRLPPSPKWEASLTSDFYMRVMLPAAPNAFYRLMQRLVLGVYWRPVTEDGETKV